MSRAFPPVPPCSLYTPKRGPLVQVGGSAGPHFSRGTIIQAAVYPRGIIMLNPLSDRRISLSEGGKIVLAQTFPFQLGMPGLDIGVIVRTMDRNPFMLDAPLMAVLVKRLRNKLGPIVGAYHGGFNPLGLPNGCGLSEGTGRIRSPIEQRLPLSAGEGRGQIFFEPLDLGRELANLGIELRHFRRGPGLAV